MAAEASAVRAASLPDPAAFAARLRDPSSDTRAKAVVVAEIKEMVEVFVNVDFAHFINTVLPVQLDLLRSTPCAFVSDAPEQRLRQGILEAIYRYPQHEAQRTHAEVLMQVMLRIVQEDNEENAALAFKIIIDLHRVFKTALQAQVQPFLELVQKLYTNMRGAVAEAFGAGADTPAAPSDVPALDGDAPVSRKLLPSSSSFKVLTECPIAIVLIFQTYRGVVGASINVFVPLIFEHCLMLQAPPQQQAHEAARQRGEVFVGVAPGIRNRALFSEMVTAQVKTMSFLAYVLRGSAPIVRQYANLLPEVNVRLLKDCPPECAPVRKELLVATRHILSTDFREHYIGQIDTLLDERVLLGTGVTTREMQRPLVVSMFADLMHHVRQELTTEQIVRVVNVHAQLLHDPTLAPSIQTMCVKLLLNLVETVVMKHVDYAVPILRGMFSTFLDKLDALYTLGKVLWDIRPPGGDAPEIEGVIDDTVRIERTKTIQSSVAVLEGVADPLKNARFLFRNILFGFKTLLTVLKHRGVPDPDGQVMGRMFVGGVRCYLLQEQRDGREEKDMVDLFTNIFIDLQPETFHEVFTTHMPFLFNEILRAPALLGIPQNLLSNDAVSRRFVEILLKFLVARLDELGTSDKKLASVSLRLFKMAFMAVTIFPEENEAILQPHLTTLIMGSLQHAGKADQPSNYYLLLRALFRSIGGGRFELLYKDVLPLLPVLLEELNALLDGAQPSERELFIDLCLTVPVRLSVLLPYLDQLMRPLVMALKSGPELVSQGLRTLELCIDNLTQEFLDPIMAPYIHDIMDALWKHLRPLPHSHQHSHTTMRILGKLGGRNRNFLQEPPALKYHDNAPPELPLRVGDSRQPFALLPAIDVSLRNIESGNRAAWDLLTTCATVLVHYGASSRQHHGELRRVIVGLFRAARQESLRNDARTFLLGLYAHVMHAEITREVPQPASLSQRHLLPLTLAVLESLAHALDGADVRKPDEEPAPAVEIMLGIIAQFVHDCETVPATRPGLGAKVMHALASAFCSMCYELRWMRRMGGWLGIDTILRRARLGAVWVVDHQLEIVRALLYMLKDMPSNPPRDVGRIGDTLFFVLEQAYGPETRAERGESAADVAARPAPVLQKSVYGKRPSHLTYLVGILIPELLCANETARSYTQRAFSLLASLKECTVTDLLMPQRDRLFLPIFTKPLRALPFGMQIGNIDAVTFGLSLPKPLPEFNEELFRVLTEALALADADDQALIGRTAQYKNVIAVTKLRVAALRLLAAAMECPDFLTQDHVPMRMRIISVYFKSLYSSAPEVVQVAHDSLKATLTQQSKLPKDLLRSGLQPVLMTLADRSRLTIAGLDGLARLLQLLTNYFKVEIGVKLLDHLSSLADPAMLRRAAAGALDTNPQLRTLAAIVRIFHLLPDTAYQFFPRLPVYVAEIEVHLRRSGHTPFTEMLVLFLDRFAEQTLHFFFENDHVVEPKLFRLLRLSLESEKGGTLRKELAARVDNYIMPLLADPASPSRVFIALQLLEPLVNSDPAFFSSSPAIYSRLLALWCSREFATLRRREADVVYSQTRTTPLFVQLLRAALAHAPNADTYIALLDLYTYRQACDVTPNTRFVYEHVCVHGSLELRRTLLERCITIAGDGDASMALRTAAVRVIATPIIVAAYWDGNNETPLLDVAMIARVADTIWRGSAPADDTLRVELLQFSTHILEHGSDLLAAHPTKLDSIKFGWASLSADDVTVKHMAYIFIARFLAAFESPVKIIGQVYIGLLRAHTGEGRALIRKALDILVPALPTRVPCNDGQTPLWVKWTRRTLLDEAYNVAQLASVLQLIARYPRLFEDSRELFMPHIVSALSKLGLSASTGAESKRLAVELTDLLVRWDHDEGDEGPTRKRIRTEQGATEVPSYAMAPHMREMVVTFLVRFISLSGETCRTGTVHQALTLLEHVCKATQWRGIPIRLALLQRSLIHTDVTDLHLVPIANALTVLDVISRDKSPAWFTAHMAQLHKLLEKTLASDNAVLLEAAHPVLVRMFSVLPVTPPGEENPPAPGDDTAAFCVYAENIINEGLRTATNLHCVLVLLRAWAAGRPEVLDRHVLPLIKALTKLTKEHLAAAVPVSANDQAVRLLLMVLELLKTRIVHLGDQRRWFLSAVVQLVEKSPSIEVCRFLLATMRAWILDAREPFPTIKEKAGILIKMLGFEQRGNEPLLREFLTLILDIYKTPAFARSELTARLESAFLLGCRNRDPELRQQFINIFDSALTRIPYARLQYLLGQQSWENAADHYWVHQALDLLLASIDTNQQLLETRDNTMVGMLHDGGTAPFLAALRTLQYLDVDVAHHVWVSTFGCVWHSTPKRMQPDINRALIGSLARDYMIRQVSARPNVVQTLLDGAALCAPDLEIPPHVAKYLGKTFQGWYCAISMLETQLGAVRTDDAVRESTQDALAELYAELSEADLFYGLWRRRCIFAESNAALALEQIGMSVDAQLTYESAQSRGSTSDLPLSESEYRLWDDHWVLCALQLQQWDILTDLAKLEGNEDLSLECAWRLSDWSTERDSLEKSLEKLSSSNTPRRKVFEAYLALLRAQAAPNKPSDFGRICDEAIQLSLYKWFTLPTQVSQAHVPLLEIFQQFVELHEASTVFTSLAHTNAANLNHRSAELKTLMQTWRERLPNLWDDVNTWSDLVAWRQHVFSAVNKAYLPLVPLIQRTEGPGSSTNSYAYRGYHETAWIINRFAHVARKHGLDDVCISSLTKIYTLPNIEIQEAFLKLREQARCYYHRPAELSQGLGVINNTNLMFFAAAQKAEFFSLKGMFLSKLGHGDEANQAFATAIQMDLNLPKSWKEWGRYSDRLFREKPTAMHFAANAISCYLQAAGLYMNAKSRKILVRILWLLNCDDAQGTLWQACDSFKGETPIWYWITFTPQLLQLLSHKDAKFARKLLMQVAKTFPQSLYYYLRTTREDYMLIKRNAMVAAQRASSRQSEKNDDKEKTSVVPEGQTQPSLPAQAGAQCATQQPPAAEVPGAPDRPTQRQPWEYIDEIMNILKTAFPLLALTMENMADQLQQRFKPSNDEDIYRLTNALLNDALQQYIHRAPLATDNSQLPQTSQINVARFAENLPPGALKTTFENDFVRSKPTLREYVARLQRWRDRYEESLDMRPRRQHLEHCSHYLVEFRHQRFDEVEVPGQYLRLKDNSANFVRISRFLPEYTLVRSGGICNRRITILSNKGSLHSFTVQLPSARYCRREERIFQLLRLLNTILDRKIQTRKRGLRFNVPIAVPISPQLRLLETDDSNVSMQDIYERHCKEICIGKDDPIVAWAEKMRSTWDGNTGNRTNVDFANLRMELMEEISVKMVSDRVLHNYFSRIMGSPSDLWLLRKQFTIQMAASMFITYVLFISARLPSRIHISRRTGAVTMSDVVPTFSPTVPHFKSPDPTPFRLSPNIQYFIGPVAIEGILTSAFMALGRALTDSEFGLEDYLGIFVRDELHFWVSGVQRQVNKGIEASREIIVQNALEVVKRVRLMSCRFGQEKSPETPVNQAVLDLINYASHPSKLALQDPTWMPWL